MPRPILATLHLSALRHNLERLRQAVPHAKLWAVIKANAYGHGIERVFPAFRAADGLALLDLSEAERVRALDWRGPVLLLEGAFEARDLEICSRLNLWHVIHCEEQIDWLAAHKTHQPHRVFLKMNSGMNRLGFTPAAFRSAWHRLNVLPQVEEISFITHFSDADGLRFGQDGITHQVATFAAASVDLPGERTVCNSAAILRHAQRPLGTEWLAADWVRCGIALYGSAPDYPEHSSQSWDLQPTMTLSSRLIAIQTLQTGDSVGYGSSFVATAPMRVGIVACGYADGYPRHAGDGTATPVLLQGQRTHLVGRVSMDMLAIDVTTVENQGRQCQIGDEVVLWGRSAWGSTLPIDEVAHAAGTIAYELMCAVAARVPFAVADDSETPIAWQR